MRDPVLFRDVSTDKIKNAIESVTSYADAAFAAAKIHEHNCSLSLNEFKQMIETKFCPKCKKRVVK